jgi:valyl-tRNA synthetase
MEMDKRYDHIKYESEAQKLWEELKTYEFDKNSNKETFSIDTPPPTVSGSLHTGHIFSYTHTDIIARYKRMLGLNVFYPMGFDDNGLPTERFVEKENKTKAHLHKRSDFIKMCLKATQDVEKNFEELWKKMGLSIDWTKTYSTIEDKVRKISQYSFIDLYKNNHILRKEEPSLYCTTCRTTVAQAEMDDSQVNTTFNDIEFETHDGQKLKIATTRPELLPACVAVFYNPKDERYKDLKDKKAIVPVFGHEVSILADDKVDMEKGTGLVMCCTFGDQTDIYWYKTHKLPFIQAVGFDGKWTSKTGPLEGLKVHEARKKVLELLSEQKKLLDQKKIQHNVGVHERCKQEIEYLILKQWFVKILDHKEEFLKLADEIEWKPGFMKSRYKDWVENLSWDWCISRQRFYGIPFPVWHCDDCGHVILADEKDLPIDPQETKYSGKCLKCNSSNISGDTDIMDTWNTSSLTPQINIGWPFDETLRYNSEQAQNHSGRTGDEDPFAVSEATGCEVESVKRTDQNLQIPMSIRPQAHDIIRTWAFYTIVKAYYHQKTIPWKEIVISGHVLSGTASAGKEKLSKSKGNSKVPGPEKLLETYPADVVRYWTAQGRLGTDTAFSENQLKIGQRTITKLWNAFRFCKDKLSSYEKFDSSKLEFEKQDPSIQFSQSENHSGRTETSLKPTSKLDNLSKWLLHNFSQAVKNYHYYFEQYNYTQALEVIEKLFWHNFCDNYLELIKDQIFNPEKYDSKTIETTKYVLYEVGFGMLQLFSPVLPHITETLYQQFYKDKESLDTNFDKTKSTRDERASIHTSTFDNSRFSFNFETEAQNFEKIIELVSTVRKLKTAKRASLKLEIEVLNIYTKDKPLVEVIKKEEALIKGITKANEINFIETEFNWKTENLCKEPATGNLDEKILFAQLQENGSWLEEKEDKNYIHINLQ